MRLLTLTTASLALLAGSAAAETYRATGVRIEHTAAVLEVIPEARNDIDVSIAGGGRLTAPSVRVEGGRVVIDGGLENRLRGCTSTVGGDAVRIEGMGSVRRDELPRITLRVPRALALHVGGAVYSTIGASSGGELALTGCGDSVVGGANGDLEISLTGSGDADVGRVTGLLAAALTGSGSMRVDSAGGNAALRLTGSGDLSVGDVTGAVDAELTGSGELHAGAVGNGAELLLTGSGDVETGAVRGALSAQLTGSGGIDVASLQGGDARLVSNSSGDVRVRAGRAERLVARTRGSGNVSFGGAAAAVDIEIRGSGDVAVADAGRVERLVDNGSGSVQIGN